MKGGPFKDSCGSFLSDVLLAAPCWSNSQPLAAAVLVYRLDMHVATSKYPSTTAQQRNTVCGNTEREVCIKQTCNFGRSPLEL